MTNAKPSVCFVNRCYWPDSEATGQLLTQLAEALTATSDVHIICGQPNSPVTDDYVRRGTEIRGGVTIHRLRHTTFAKRIPAGRIINLISFAAAARRYLRRCGQRFDILVSETDPFLLPPVVAGAAKRQDAKFVAYLQDIYPDVAIAIGKAKPGYLTRWIRRRLREAYVSADVVIVLGRCMRDRLTAKPWSIDSNRIRIVANWADTSSIGPQPRDQNEFVKTHQLDDSFVVMHSGNMGLTQRLDVAIESADCSAWPGDAVLMLVGDGATKHQLQSDASTRFGELDGRVRFLPYQPREQLGQSLSAADAHLVSMDAAITGCLCPSKLYGIMAAGRPVIAVADEATELAQVVRQHSIGIIVQPGRPDQIAAAVNELKNQPDECREMGHRAREVAVKLYDRRVLIGRIESILQSLVHTSPVDGGSMELSGGANSPNGHSTTCTKEPNCTADPENMTDPGDRIDSRKLTIDVTH